MLDERFKAAEWASFHDVVFEALGKSLEVKELKDIFNSLSEHTQATALEWGLSDTVFGDQAYKELKKMPV